MTVKNNLEYINRRFDKYSEITGKTIKELHDPTNAIKVSESRLDLRNTLAKSNAGFKYYPTAYKTGNSYVRLMDKGFEKYLYKGFSKLKINKQTKRKSKNNG